MLFILVTLIVGLAAGFLADLVFPQFSFSLIGKFLLGVAGAVLGALIFGLDGSLLFHIFTAFVGAIILLGVTAIIQRRR